MPVMNDREMKANCVKLFKTNSFYRCMVMPGPPPLIAEMFETWDSTYDSYCSRCERFIFNTTPKDEQLDREDAIEKHAKRLKQEYEQRRKNNVVNIDEEKNPMES